MTSAWVLQANPDRYDIEAAMKALTVIHWGVPQHTSEIHPGDRIVIWRSGSDAGIVARGVVQAPSAQMTGAAQEGEYSHGNPRPGTILADALLRRRGAPSRHWST